jgi:hypothetical protein
MIDGEHSLEIDGLKMVAQSPKADIPEVRKKRKEIPIANGPSKWIFKGHELRHNTFQARIVGHMIGCKDIIEIREKLKPLNNKVCDLVSLHFGTMKCMVFYDIEYEDGTENYLIANFDVQEVV